MTSPFASQSTAFGEFRTQAGWAIALTVLFAIGAVLPRVVFFSDPSQYAMLHLVLEFLSMAISLMIVALAWNLRDLEINSQIVLIGFISFAVLLVDLVHTLSFPGMPALVTEASTQKAITFWLVGRAIAAVGLLLVALVPSRHWSPRVWLPGLALITAACAGVWWAGLYHPEAFPVFFIPGEGLTTIKRVLEYSLSATYALAAVLLLVRAVRERSRDLAWLATAAWTLTLAELYFTLYVTASDTFNLLGHLLKVAAYLMVYRAIFAAGVQDPHRRLAHETSLLKSLIDSIPDLISFTDQQGRLLGANRAFRARFHLNQEEVVGRTPVDVVWAGTRDSSRAHVNTGSVERYEEALSNPDGSREFYDTVQTPYYSESGDSLGLIEVSRDITTSKENEERIRYLALYDHLTGLPNRTMLGERVRISLADPEARGLTQALVFLDLDDFKTINDTVGHRVGDLIIKETALRLSDVAGPGIEVARLGGDEFAAYAAHRSLDEAAHLVRSLLDAIEHPFRIEQYDLALTASAGIAMSPTDGTTFDELSAHADAAMYRAKQEGRNRHRFFSGEMLLDSAERLELLSALRRAVDNNEFVVHYQPQWSILDKSMVGVEALVRWQHPSLGLLPPSAFIGIAEDSGLILPIGEAVLRTAVTDGSSWQPLRPDGLTVAVNLSAVQFVQTDLSVRIRRILEETGFPPERLELEITETMAMASPEIVTSVLERLRELGIRFSIDDFGTGYSSMAYLRRFRIDRLKIDRSFVENLGRDPDDEAIARAIIQLAKALRIETIAEGVETEAQLDFLRFTGCDYIQGFYLSPPVPADAITQLLQPVLDTT